MQFCKPLLLPGAPLISTKLLAMSSATSAWPRALFMATLNVITWAPQARVMQARTSPSSIHRGRKRQIIVQLLWDARSMMPYLPKQHHAMRDHQCQRHCCIRCQPPRCPPARETHYVCVDYCLLLTLESGAVELCSSMLWRCQRGWSAPAAMACDKDDTAA